MEQDFGSECSSGCDSGWTLYFQQSCYPSSSLQNRNNVNDNGNEFSGKKISSSYEDDEEDMSMVSDASSGPPHFQQQKQQHECPNNNNKNKNGKRQTIPKDVNLHRKIQDLPSFLDDTASSPFFNFSNNNLTVPIKKASMEENDSRDYSQGYSTTYFEVKSTFQDHFGYFHPSVSGTQLQQNQWF